MGLPQLIQNRAANDIGKERYMELLYFHSARNLANMTDVGFYDRFELLEMLRDDGVKSFRAKEISTGRDVEAHIFVNPHAPLSMALLSRLNKLPEPERERIVDRGKNHGTPYVVTTPFADFPGLREWLSVKRNQPADPERPDFAKVNGFKSDGSITPDQVIGPKEFKRVVLSPPSQTRARVMLVESLPASGDFTAAAANPPPPERTAEVPVEAATQPVPAPPPLPEIPAPHPIQAQEPPQVLWTPPAPVVRLAESAPPPPRQSQLPQYLSLALSTLALVLVLLVFFTRK